LLDCHLEAADILGPAISANVIVVNAAPTESQSAPKSLGFPKSVRLLKHSDFQHVYKDGKRHFSGLLTAFYLLRTDHASLGPRIGITVGRVLGGSVQRNRIKRRMREAIRFQLCELTSPVDVVFNPKKVALTAEFTQIEQEVKRAFEVIQKTVDRLEKKN
jgi:ribonuclease P protein component